MAASFPPPGFYLCVRRYILQLRLHTQRTSLVSRITRKQLTGLKVSLSQARATHYNRENKVIASRPRKVKPRLMPGLPRRAPTGKPGPCRSGVRTPQQPGQCQGCRHPHHQLAAWHLSQIRLHRRHTAPVPTAALGRGSSATGEDALGDEGTATRARGACSDSQAVLGSPDGVDTSLHLICTCSAPLHPSCACAARLGCRVSAAGTASHCIHSTPKHPRAP